MTAWPHTYIERVAMQVYWATGEIDSCWPNGEETLWLGYAVLCLAKGTQTTSEDVHDAWSAWATVKHNGAHRSLIPFNELPPEIAAYDDLYRDAIHQVARERRTANGAKSLREIYDNAAAERARLRDLTPY